MIEEHYDDCDEGFSINMTDVYRTDDEDDIKPASKEEIAYEPQCGIEQLALFGPILAGIPKMLATMSS